MMRLRDLDDTVAQGIVGPNATNDDLERMLFSTGGWAEAGEFPNQIMLLLLEAMDVKAIIIDEPSLSVIELNASGSNYSEFCFVFVRRPGHYNATRRGDDKGGGGGSGSGGGGGNSGGGGGGGSGDGDGDGQMYVAAIDAIAQFGDEGSQNALEVYAGARKGDSGGSSSSASNSRSSVGDGNDNDDGGSNGDGDGSNDKKRKVSSTEKPASSTKKPPKKKRK
jgi:hypothetical protein